MHIGPEEGGVKKEEVCQGVSERNVEELVGGNNREDCIVV